MKHEARIALACLSLVSVACSAAGGGTGAVGAGAGAGGYREIAQGGAAASAGSGGFSAGAGGDPGSIVVPPAGTDAGSGGAPVTPPPPTNQPVSIDECQPTNAAGLDATATQKLMAGSGSAGGLRLLYPYDGTVLPRGLIAPLFMWDGVTADAVYVHIKSSQFEYRGCFKPTGANQLQLPQPVWEQATSHTGGAADPFAVELTVSSGGVATGPVSQKLVVAQATLKGSIFYNSYTTKLLTGQSIFGGTSGAVLRIVPGKSAEVFLGQSGCTGCHSVSADGSRLISLAFGSFTGGATYALTPGGPVNPPALSATAPDTSFTGLYPDGSLYVSNAHQGGVGPRAGGPGTVGSATSNVYDTATGAPIASTGVPATVMTPSFSPDGTLLAFTDYAIDQGRGLALMTFDKGSRTASAYKQVYKTAAPNYPAWPFVLPDDEGVVFAIGPTADFSANGAGLGFAGALVPAPASDVYILDVASGSAKVLAKAMGFATDQDFVSGATYLPFGPAEETHHNYYPTSSPVAAGGYFWIFFDSYRHYGNLGLQRQLWGTAVDISPSGTYTVDPSHPAFYLTGQELGTGNHRAFTALDPCHKDGDACTTGIDCCGGFCTNGSCNKPPPPVMGGPTCAKTDESCAGGTPCCNAKDHCIAGFCGQILQ
jgi:hypothetical protein